MIDTNPPTLGPWLDSLNDLMDMPLTKEEQQALALTATVTAVSTPTAVVPVAAPAPKPIVAPELHGAHTPRPITIRARVTVLPRKEAK